MIGMISSHLLLLLTECFDVCGVFFSAGRLFIGYEILPADEKHRRLIVLAWNLIQVCFFPRNSANSCDDIDAYGRNAELDYFARRSEIILRQILRTEAKLIQSSKNSLGVFADRPDEQVDIAGKARGAMKGQGVTAYDEVFNFVLVVLGTPDGEQL